jgi:hypothetical protein
MRLLLTVLFLAAAAHGYHMEPTLLHWVGFLVVAFMSVSWCQCGSFQKGEETAFKDVSKYLNETRGMMPEERYQEELLDMFPEEAGNQVPEWDEDDGEPW